jgi:hypothetical protein
LRDNDNGTREGVGDTMGLRDSLWFSLLPECPPVRDWAMTSGVSFTCSGRDSDSEPPSTSGDSPHHPLERDPILKLRRASKSGSGLDLGWQREKGSRLGPATPRANSGEWEALATGAWMSHATSAKTQAWCCLSPLLQGRNESHCHPQGFWEDLGQLLF